MTTPEDSLLGRSAAYPERYDPGLLFPIARAAQRAALGIDGDPPFHGVDVWNAYELSWLDARGKPEVAVAELRVPATTPNLIESKSLKLYLASFNQERLAGADALRERIAADLANAAGARVEVALAPSASFPSMALATLAGESLDTLRIAIDRYAPPDAGSLETEPSEVEERLVTDLFKSNCPVTGQPDWASVAIAYAGPRIAREGLLRYLVSFRAHADFHESCVERIYMDILRRCAPRRLSVYARYTRRGGLDINPWRASEPSEPPNPRTARQ